MPTNRRVVLAERPVGMPKESDFRLESQDTPEAGPGQVLVQTHYISVDPYMRGRISGRKSYIEPIPIDGVVEGGSAGVVVESRSDSFKEGDVVHGMWGWQEYGLVDANSLHAFDTALGPMSTSLGVLGMPGLTAYFGMLDVGQPKAGEQVFVSGAAGAVGSLAGQIAKIQGCRVAGSAGSSAKVRHLLDDLGFDEAFDYHETSNYPKEIVRLFPDGVDVYFDNVGGNLSDAVWMNLAEGARIPICGQIDMYNATDVPRGPRLQFQLIVKRARAEGFLIFDYANRFTEGLKQIAAWLHEGKIQYKETFTDGIEHTPSAFIGLFKGENIGKQLVRTQFA